MVMAGKRALARKAPRHRLRSLVRQQPHVGRVVAAAEREGHACLGKGRCCLVGGRVMVVGPRGQLQDRPENDGHVLLLQQRGGAWRLGAAFNHQVDALAIAKGDGVADVGLAVGCGRPAAARLRPREPAPPGPSRAGRCRRRRAHVHAGSRQQVGERVERAVPLFLQVGVGLVGLRLALRSAVAGLMGEIEMRCRLTAGASILPTSSRRDASPRLRRRGCRRPGRRRRS